jgi:hypothetical protein
LPAPGLFPGRNVWLRAAVALAAGVGVSSLLLAVAAPLLGVSANFAASARSDAMLVVPASLVLVLVLLYALATSCPSCARWWARAEGETASLGREVVDRGGVRRVRLRQQTTYRCRYCGHAWSTTYTDEYKAGARGRRGAWR